jgi:uncharacterized protein YaiE (UPF0345 family)
MPYIGRTLSQGTRSRFLYTATAGQTTFSGSDTQSNTLAYADNNGVDCFQNGVLLKTSVDYQATTGTSVVLTTGASVNDVIEILVYDVFAIADHVKKSGDAMTGALTNIDVNGTELILDADGDTSIEASTDDVMTFKTANTERMRVDASGNLAIGTTSASDKLHLDGSGAFIRVNRTDGEAGITLMYNGSNSTRSNIVTDTSGNLTFDTAHTERMRIDSSGRVLIGATTYDASNAGVYLNGASGKGFFTVSGDAPLAIHRLASDGDLVELRQAGNTEGTISVSGSTVSYNGFSGQHESSGIATNTEIGTVISTIDELDTYASGDKKGQTRADHAKVKVSDTAGDKAVYGVVSRFDADDKVYVASVGIGSVRVTGACAKGDLLESNGDGTAKVQSDDIVRSKTIGKVTIGNSSTDEKLVSCVLYCG